MCVRSQMESTCPSAAGFWTVARNCTIQVFFCVQALSGTNLKPVPASWNSGPEFTVIQSHLDQLTGLPAHWFPRDKICMSCTASGRGSGESEAGLAPGASCPPQPGLATRRLWAALIGFTWNRWRKQGPYTVHLSLEEAT
jgi:hypothetical protein